MKDHFDVDMCPHCGYIVLREGRRTKDPDSLCPVCKGIEYKDFYMLGMAGEVIYKAKFNWHLILFWLLYILGGLALCTFLIKSL